VMGQGRMALISDFAFRLPVIVICDMLGIPETDREIFFKRERTGGRLLDPVPLSRAELKTALNWPFLTVALVLKLPNRGRRWLP